MPGTTKPQPTTYKGFSDNFLKIIIKNVKDENVNIANFDAYEAIGLKDRALGLLKKNNNDEYDGEEVITTSEKKLPTGEIKKIRTSSKQDTVIKQIKYRFHQTQLKNHPDKSKNGEEVAKDGIKAWSILSNETVRNEYDKHYEDIIAVKPSPQFRQAVKDRLQRLSRKTDPNSGNLGNEGNDVDGKSDEEGLDVSGYVHLFPSPTFIDKKIDKPSSKLGVNDVNNYAEQIKNKIKRIVYGKKAPKGYYKYQDAQNENLEILRDLDGKREGEKGILLLEFDEPNHYLYKQVIKNCQNFLAIKKLVKEKLTELNNLIDAEGGNLQGNTTGPLETKLRKLGELEEVGHQSKSSSSYSGSFTIDYTKMKFKSISDSNLLTEIDKIFKELRAEISKKGSKPRNNNHKKPGDPGKDAVQEIELALKEAAIASISEKTILGSGKTLKEHFRSFQGKSAIDAEFLRLAKLIDNQGQDNDQEIKKGQFQGLDKKKIEQLRDNFIKKITDFVAKNKDAVRAIIQEIAKALQAAAEINKKKDNGEMNEDEAKEKKKDLVENRKKNITVEIAKKTKEGHQKLAVEISELPTQLFAPHKSLEEKLNSLDKLEEISAFNEKLLAAINDKKNEKLEVIVNDAIGEIEQEIGTLNIELGKNKDFKEKIKNSRDPDIIEMIKQNVLQLVKEQKMAAALNETSFSQGNQPEEPGTS
ncbi:10734_t:CDS:2 [Entrophospora sp. SA101]|nr:10734_t:CDS:2 [Entrophospora sp. SA101]